MPDDRVQERCEVNIVSLAACKADEDKSSCEPEHTGEHESKEHESKEEDGRMKAELKIEGMMCQHCQKHVHDALSKMEGVASVKVDLEKKTALVESDREIPVEEFRRVIADAGYELV